MEGNQQNIYLKMKVRRGYCACTFAILAVITFLFLLTIVKCVACAKVANVEVDNSTIFPILKPNYTRSTNSSQNQQQQELNHNSIIEIDWEKDFKNCGVTIDSCPSSSSSSNDPSSNQFNQSNVEDDKNGTSSSGNKNGTATGRSLPSLPAFTPAMLAALPDEYMIKPVACRCDNNCVKYGDCCKSILTKQMKELPERESYYRCVKLINTEYSVKMISKCPKSYAGGSLNINKALCEDPHCPSRTFNINKASCPNLEAPVVNNKTGDIYRNIFCARCHSISNRDIHPLNKTLMCTNFSSLQDFENFQKRAEYQPGKFRFVDSSNSSVFCDLYIRDLQPNVIKRLVPEVRFCESAAQDDCSLDLTKEENRITQRLCASYTQVVRNSSDHLFKNPHCAKCQDPEIDFKKWLKCERWAPRGKDFSPIFLPNSRMSETGPVGINILFHFSLDMDDNYVGYTSKCEENEILDFIRHKCVPAICQKGYELVEGHCMKKVTETGTDSGTATSPSASNNKGNNGSDFDDGGQTRNTSLPLILPRGTSHPNSSTSNADAFNSSANSEPCLVLILHKGEYRLLPNGSLTVNKSGGSSDEGVIMFMPGEFETYNESTMSVCAENVEKTFESSFGPALSYISTILLVFSVLCSGIHVALYLILPQMRNLPGNNLLCLTLCLFISQFIFLTLIKSSDRSICVIASITMHYLFLASFCWMNIMSFDIWRTFSSEFLVRRYSGDSLKTFLKYSAFAWLVPLLIVILAVVADFSLPDGLLSDPDFGPLWRKLRPMYGHNNLCWIGQRLSLFVFFAFPVAVIILCNLVLFTLTASTIWLQNREGSRFINGSGGGGTNGRNKVNKPPLHGCNSGSTKKSDRIRFKLYAKLALIMGLTWILGFLSGLTEWEWLWYPFVIFNGLQGTFIFIAFDCKAKIWNLVREKSCWGTQGGRGKGSRSTNTGDIGSTDLKRRTLSSTLTSSSARTSTTTTTESSESQKNTKNGVI